MVAGSAQFSITSMQWSGLLPIRSLSCLIQLESSVYRNSWKQLELNQSETTFGNIKMFSHPFGSKKFRIFEGRSDKTFFLFATLHWFFKLIKWSEMAMWLNRASERALKILLSTKKSFPRSGFGVSKRSWDEFFFSTESKYHFSSFLKRHKVDADTRKNLVGSYFCRNLRAPKIHFLSSPQEFLLSYFPYIIV